MFYRKTLSTIVALLLLATVFTIPNTGNALEWPDCWRSNCAPPGPSYYFDKNGCTVFGLCGGIFYCTWTVCPEDIVDNSGNCDDSESCDANG